MDALVDSRAVVERSEEEGIGGEALAKERGDRETDNMGEAPPMLIVVVVVFVVLLWGMGVEKST